MALTTTPATGCVHGQAVLGRSQHHAAVAGAARLADAGILETRRGHRLDGVVDLSEPPTVVDTPLDATAPSVHRFAPGPTTIDPDVGMWVSDRFDGSISQIDLRNTCSLELDFAFAPSDDPGQVAGPRRVLDGYTAQTQLIPEGHWLHLWNDGRWLGAAVTNVSAGVMEISPSCDTLEVRFERPKTGLTRFAIHWELDADADADANERARPRTPSVGALELALEQRDTPEPWGLEQVAEPGDRVDLRLANLCAEPVAYAFSSSNDDTPTITSTIPGHTERSVEVPAGWWLRYQALDEVWRGGATTSLAGSVVWLASNCIDFGIGDGQIIAPGQ